MSHSTHSLSAVAAETALAKSAVRHLGVFALCLAALSILFLTFFPIEDNDVWWLLAAGREMVRTGRPLMTDVFTCTINGQPWMNKYMPFEILIYLLYAAGGVNALIALRSLLVLGALLIISFHIIIWRRRKGAAAPDAFLASFILLVTGFLMIPRMFVRPELFSFICFALLFLLWEHVRGRPLTGGFMAALFLLQAFWTNMHSAFVLGYFVSGAFLLERGVERRYFSLKEWFAIPLQVLSSLINPYGLRMPGGVLDVMRTPFYHRHLWEWQPLFSRIVPEPLRWIVLCWCLVTVAGFLVNRRRIRIAHLLLVLFFFIMTLKARRHGVYFALSAGVSNLWNYGYILGVLKNRVPAFARTAAVCALLIFLLIFNRAIPSGTLYHILRVSRPFGFGINNSRYPWDCATFMKSEKMSGNLFNGYDCGGYLIWRLSPDLRPCIDSRAEPFPPALVERHYRIITGDEPPDAFLKEFNITIAMIDLEDRDLLSHFYKMADWNLSFMGHKSAVFTKIKPHKGDKE
ncbi:MAG: hypothetical protein NT106_14895 [Candidatus Sumerlaeota bacterium]|nr:hypothetical protein [Candidatus Sumerlaeota bacterium]